MKNFALFYDGAFTAVNFNNTMLPFPNSLSTEIVPPIPSPVLQNGASYEVYSGGSSSGSGTDGLFSGGSYAPATQVTSFTITSMVTGGGGEGMFPRGPGGGAPGTFPRNRQTGEPPGMP